MSKYASSMSSALSLRQLASGRTKALESGKRSFEQLKTPTRTPQRQHCEASELFEVQAQLRAFSSAYQQNMRYVAPYDSVIKCHLSAIARLQAKLESPSQVQINASGLSDSEELDSRTQNALERSNLSFEGAVFGLAAENEFALRRGLDYSEIANTIVALHVSLQQRVQIQAYSEFERVCALVMLLYTKHVGCGQMTVLDVYCTRNTENQDIMLLSCKIADGKGNSRVITLASVSGVPNVDPLTFTACKRVGCNLERSKVANPLGIVACYLIASQSQEAWHFE